MNYAQHSKWLDRILRIGPYEAMREDEIAAGRTLVDPGDAPWFPGEDWAPSVVSISGKTVRIVAIRAKTPGYGAFSRMLRGIEDAGLSPVVVGPLPHMKQILKRWGWSHRIEGEGFFSEPQWRPGRAG